MLVDLTKEELFWLKNQSLKASIGNLEPAPNVDHASLYIKLNRAWSKSEKETT